MHGQNEDLIQGADALHARMSGIQRQLLASIAELDRRDAWRDSGARDLAHWLSMRYGISHWKAIRWIAAAHALQNLPRVERALSCGELNIDKVVELTRFATPETEEQLVVWAMGVSCGCIRRRGDLAARQPADASQEVDRSRSVSWWYFDEGRRFGLEADLPAAEGAKVARSLERLAERMPVMPGEEDAFFARARRADALVALASNQLAGESDGDRATVVVHAQADALGADATGSGAMGSGAIDGGGVIGSATAQRLACFGRLQAVVEDAAGQPIGLGRISREPSSAMMRLLRYRDDGECRFPGCGSRRFVQAHHIRWWTRGGRTDLDNLLLVCTFHHKLVHEYGWSVRRDRDGHVSWRPPDGGCHRPEPAPPREPVTAKALALARGP